MIATIEIHRSASSKETKPGKTWKSAQKRKKAAKDLGLPPVMTELSMRVYIYIRLG